MFTYVILNIVFMAVVLVALRRWLPALDTRLTLAMIAILTMTAVFDSLIITFDIVAYDMTKILGIYIFQAPVEDFAYALLAILIVPALWKYFEDRSAS